MHGELAGSMYFFEYREETEEYLIAKTRQRMYSKGGNRTNEIQNFRMRKSDIE